MSRNEKSSSAVGERTEGTHGDQEHTRRMALFSPAVLYTYQCAIFKRDL